MLVTKTNKNNFEDKIKVKVETIDNYCKKIILRQLIC